MALQVSFQTKYGFTASDAYVVISEAVYIKEKPALFIAKVYKNHQARLDNAEPLSMIRHSFEYDTDGSNIIEQAYEALKLLPSMSGYIDV